MSAPVDLDAVAARLAEHIKQDAGDAFRIKVGMQPRAPSLVADVVALIAELRTARAAAEAWADVLVEDAAADAHDDCLFGSRVRRAVATYRGRTTRRQP